MKKIISALISLAVVFTIGISCYAATFAASPESPHPVPNVSAESGDSDIIVVVENCTLTSAQNKALKDNTDEKDHGAVFIYDVWLQSKSTGKDVTKSYNGYPIKVTFDMENATEIDRVLYWNEDNGSWDEASFTIADGKIKVRFNHLCPVAFVFKADTGAKTPGSSIFSAQTGYNILLYVILAVVLLIMAIIIFILVARRSRRA